MRVADRTTARNYLKYLNKAKNDLAKTTDRIASGKRFTSISEDVSAGTKVLRSRMDLYKSQKQLDNVESINDELTTTESTLMTINDIIGEVHSTKIVKAMSENTGEAGRLAIANEISALKDQVLSLANTKYGKKYIFGGTNASYQEPFSLDNDGKLLYNGIDVSAIQKKSDGSYFYTDGGEEKPIPMDSVVYTDIGLGIKMDGNDMNPNTGFKVSYSGLDILGFGVDADGNSNNIYTVLSDLEASLRNYDKDKLGSYDTKLVNLTDSYRASITDIGAKTSFLDIMKTRLENDVDGYKTRIDRLMGTDDAEEATNQTMNDYVLKAVLQMGANILPRSLMDYIS